MGTHSMKSINHTFNQHGGIDCEIEHPVHGWIPFTASKYDVEERGRNIFAQYEDDADVLPYVPPSDEEVENLASMSARSYRDQLLAQCDWTQLSDSPPNADEWAIYRQSLRDITSSKGFPSDIVWPEKPIEVN